MHSGMQHRKGVGGWWKIEIRYKMGIRKIEAELELLMYRYSVYQDYHSLQDFHDFRIFICNSTVSFCSVLLFCMSVFLMSLPPFKKRCYVPGIPPIHPYDNLLMYYFVSKVRDLLLKFLFKIALSSLKTDFSQVRKTKT